MVKDVEAWVDGAVSNNGNKNGSGYAFGGIGIVMKLNTEDKLYTRNKGFYGSTLSSDLDAVTNNRMELLAVIETLEYLQNKKISEVKVYSDSAYVVNGWNDHIHNWIKRGWKTLDKSPVKNQDLWERFIKLNEIFQSKNKTLKIIKVAGHSDNVNHNMADKLAVEATKLIKDEIHERQTKS